jgi:hypothetical protein
MVFFAFMSMVTNLDCTDSQYDFVKIKNDFLNLSKKLVEDGNLSNTTARKMLLNIMKKNGLSELVGLYLATNPEKTQWSRLTLDTNGEILPTPCN